MDSVKVSKEAADLAVAVEIIRHPDLARQLAPAIEAVTRSAALLGFSSERSPQRRIGATHADKKLRRQPVQFLVRKVI